MHAASFARFATTLTLASSLAHGALAGQDLLWEVPYPSATVYGSSQSVFVQSAQVNVNREVADDFNATGTIERLVVPGRGCSQCGTPVVDGAYVRFYEWTPNGPGALQQEIFASRSSGAMSYNGTYPYTVYIDLPQTFEASGWHFVSVQVAFANGGVWNFAQNNRNNAINSTAYARNNLAGGAWGPDQPNNPPFPFDVAISMYGQAGAVQPSIEEVSRSTVTGSDRIIVTGADFGAPGDGQLEVNGLEAIVTMWSSTKIIGYVPEGLTPGPASLTITNLGVESDPTPITIVPREPDGRVKWVFEGDDSYASFEPAIGADGTLYFADIGANLYAVTADGALLWIVDALLGQEGLADEAPVQVGADGTIYVATNPLGPTVELVAFNPDGSHKWTFTVPTAMTWQAGPTIGPDGRLYAALNNSQFNGLDYDVLAINVDGTPAWTTPADPAIFETAAPGSRMVFGPSTPGGPLDQMLFTEAGLAPFLNYSFRISDGQQNFTVPLGSGNDSNQTQLAVDQDTGDFYMLEFNGVGGLGWGLQAFDSGGARIWRFDPGIASGASQPVVGPDGVIYFSWDGGRISAVSPVDEDDLWTRTSNRFYGEPVPSPTAPVLLAGGSLGFGQPGFIEARRTTDGELLWSQIITDDVGDDVSVDSRPIFTPDGATAYFTTLETPHITDSVVRLYAVDMSAGDFCPGDVDGDGVIGFNDLNLLLGDYGQSGAGMPGDIDGDGDVDFSDLNALLGVYGQSC